MKTIPIIGGGIAGLTMANLFYRNNIDFKLFERSSEKGTKGHGFIIPSEGFEILKSFINEEDLLANGNKLCQYISFDNKGNEIDKIEMRNDYMISRKALVDLLQANIPKEFVFHDKNAVDINLSDNGIEEIYFSDKTTCIPSSIVVASDGSRSTLRAKLIEDKQLREAQVHEIVNIFEEDELATYLGNSFFKFHHEDGGLSMGLLKVNQNEVLCYAQFDINKYSLHDETAHGINEFMQFHFNDWSALVSLVLKKTNFENAHYWRVNELDILENYYYKNTVFVGDTAHSLLPFTSQGVNAAIQDAQVLVESLLKHSEDYEQAFQEYTSIRKPEIAIHFANGRLLRDNFLQSLEKQKTNVIPISFK